VTTNQQSRNEGGMVIAAVLSIGPAFFASGYGIRVFDFNLFEAIGTFFTVASTLFVGIAVLLIWLDHRKAKP
jgi:membrane protein implicated in regulation of membrane protease activity